MIWTRSWQMCVAQPAQAVFYICPIPATLPYSISRQGQYSHYLIRDCRSAIITTTANTWVVCLYRFPLLAGIAGICIIRIIYTPLTGWAYWHASSIRTACGGCQASMAQALNIN